MTNTLYWQLMPWKNDTTMHCYLVFVFSIALIGTESYNDEGVEKVTFDTWWRKWSVVRLHKNNANDIVANVTLPLQLKIKNSGAFSLSYLALNLNHGKSYQKQTNNDWLTSLWINSDWNSRNPTFCGSLGSWGSIVETWNMISIPLQWVKTECSPVRSWTVSRPPL